MNRNLPPVITRVELPGVPHFRSGKVREVFDLGEHLLFVATDRISAFDCILPTGIPGKGHVLTQLSAWWFQRLAGIVPHHVVTSDVRDFPALLRPFTELLRGRSMLVQKSSVIPIECVARGYLVGSGWKDYQRTGGIAGLPLRPGYQLADRIDEPVFTPAHKAEAGHDENTDFAEVARLVGDALAARLRDTTLKLYTEAAAHALTRGIILADTKFEFGLRDGRLILVDEALTPDSSRYWPAASYRPGTSPPSFDKQFVRDYLESLSWDKTPPAPPLPDDVVRGTTARYMDAFQRLTGRDIET